MRKRVRSISFKRGSRTCKSEPVEFLNALKSVQQELRKIDEERTGIKHEIRPSEPKPINTQRLSRETTSSLPYKVGRQHTEPFTSTLEILTHTSYVLDSLDNPQVIIKIDYLTEFRRIYSCLITTDYGNPTYGIKQFSSTGEIYTETETSLSFKDLYKAPWIKSDRQAKNELDSLEQTIRLKQKNIKSHLETEITTN